MTLEYDIIETSKDELLLDIEEDIVNEKDYIVENCGKLTILVSDAERLYELEFYPNEKHKKDIYLLVDEVEKEIRKALSK